MATISAQCVMLILEQAVESQPSIWLLNMVTIMEKENLSLVSRLQ
jgi:hypothetical protein